MFAKPDLVLGVDASTTAVKAIAWDRNGNAAAEGRCALQVFQSRPGWHEQEADEWRQALRLAVRQVFQSIHPRRLAAMCIAHQRETFVLVDGQGKPLRHAILWMDERARAFLPALESRYGRDQFHRLTGKPLSGNLLPGKLAWLRQFEPEVFNRIHKILDVHACLVHYLTDAYRTSAASADPMGLFDMVNGVWAQEVLAEVGIALTQMPEAFPPGAVIGEVSPEAAVDCGLPPGLPIVAGLGDGQSGGLGAGVTQPGESYLNLGTAVVSGTISRHYLTDRAFRTHYAGLPGHYSLETVILSGAYTHRWWVEFLNQAAGRSASWTEDRLDELAARIPPGAQGLMLVPYLNTALNPYWDAGASGITVGWRGLHGPAHFYRAILEGIAFEQRLATEGVESALGETIAGYIAFGGGARSRLWLQIIADVTGKTLQLAHAPEATALGAGILAAVAVGFYPDAAQAARAMTRRMAETFIPEDKRHARYDRLYQEVYRHLFPALQTCLGRLTEISEATEASEAA